MSDRQFGLGMATALVVGNTIGMGIFMQPAALAPFGLNALTGWAAVIFGCVCLAVSFAALARKLPEAAGPFGYVRATLGEVIAFPALWCYWISVWATLPVLAIGVVGYFVNVFPAAAAISPAVLAVSFIWIFIAVNLLGVRSGGRVQVATSLLKVVPLVLVMVVGAFSILSDPGSWTPNLPATPITGHASMAAAAVALYAMLGFESAAIAAGRVKDPQRTIPRATLIGTLVVAALYVSIVAIGMLVVPQETLAASDAPVVTLADRLLGPGDGRWLSLFVVVSGLGCLNGWALLAGELTRTLASHRLLPPILGESNRFGVPWASLLLTGGLATALGIARVSFGPQVLGRILNVLGEKALQGFFLTLTPPTRDMETEAVKAGFAETEHGRFRKLQILTIEALLTGARPEMPFVDSAAFKRARREDAVSSQGEMDL